MSKNKDVTIDDFEGYPMAFPLHEKVRALFERLAEVEAERDEQAKAVGVYMDALRQCKAERDEALAEEERLCTMLDKVNEARLNSLCETCEGNAGMFVEDCDGDGNVTSQTIEPCAECAGSGRGWVGEIVRERDAALEQSSELHDALFMVAGALRTIIRFGDDVIVSRASDALDQVNAARSKATCQVPPDGWYCTRIAGHGGPCAAMLKAKS